MFFFDEEQEDQHPLYASFKNVNDAGFGGMGRAILPTTGTGKMGNNNGRITTVTSDSRANGMNYQGRESFATDFYLGGGEDDDDDSPDWTSSSEENEELSELVPMSIRSTKRNRQRSSTKTGFHDFYKLLDENLGNGAYGSVRTCVYIPTGKELAVKIVDKATASHTRSRIQREVDTFNICRHHPNIVQLIEWFEDSEYFYMVFEKMNGGPLLDHIQRKKCFTEHEASQVTRDIASALKFLHDHGIAHRDVKPENILCTDKDRVSPVKLCDLDLASKLHLNAEQKVASEPDLASPVGSAEFMAPEVVDAFVGEALKYDKKCDMWSLGVIVYIMLCGYPPFYGECGSEDCGWDLGEQCDECQQNLFERIQEGYFEFPEEEWASISESAKDLIEHLLVRDAKKRLTADEVLHHPWVTGGAPSTELLTPGNLIRNDSTRDVHQIKETFQAMSRIYSGRISLPKETGLPLPGNLQQMPILKIEEVDVHMPSQSSPTKPPPSWIEEEEEEEEEERNKTPVFDIGAAGDPHHFSRKYYQYEDRPEEPIPIPNPRGGALHMLKTGGGLSSFPRHTPPNGESCQSAIARQDSTKEVCDKRREQPVDA